MHRPTNEWSCWGELEMWRWWGEILFNLSPIDIFNNLIFVTLLLKIDSFSFAVLFLFSLVFLISRWTSHTTQARMIGYLFLFLALSTANELTGQQTCSEGASKDGDCGCGALKRSSLYTEKGNNPVHFHDSKIECCVAYLSLSQPIQRRQRCQREWIKAKMKTWF